MELIHSICECLSLQLVPSAPSALSLWEPAWQIRIAGPLLALHTNYGSALSPATMSSTNSSQTARHHNISNNNLMKIVTKLAHCLLPAFRHVMYIIMLLCYNVDGHWYDHEEDHSVDHHNHHHHHHPCHHLPPEVLQVGGLIASKTNHLLGQ